MHQGIYNPQVPPGLLLRSHSSKHIRGTNQPLLQKRVSSRRLKSKPGKSVDFDLQGVQVDMNRAELTPEERHDMWFGRATKKQAMAAAAALRESPEECLDEATHTYLACFQQALTTCHSNNKLEQLPPISIHSSARGLEPIIFPEMVQMRTRVVGLVLKAQRKLPPTATLDQRAALLRSVSKNLTKPSRRIARVLAVGDAAVVAEELRRPCSTLLEVA